MLHTLAKLLINTIYCILLVANIYLLISYAHTFNIYTINLDLYAQFKPLFLLNLHTTIFFLFREKIAQNVFLQFFHQHINSWLFANIFSFFSCFLFSESENFQFCVHVSIYRGILLGCWVLRFLLLYAWLCNMSL